MTDFGSQTYTLTGKYWFTKYYILTGKFSSLISEVESVRVCRHYTHLYKGRGKV